MRFMIQAIILLGFVFPFAYPATAEQNARCYITDLIVPFSMVYSGDYNSDVAAMPEAIASYLAEQGSPSGLQEGLQQAATPDASLMSPVVYESDFTGDSSIDVLVRYALSYNRNAYDATMMLFSCSAEGYQLLDTVNYSGYTLYTDEDGHYALEPFNLIVDLNNNQRREIAFRYQVISGQKAFTGISIYEWNGNTLENVFALSPAYEAFGLNFANLDANPLTLELVIDQNFAYESGTATAYIEYNFYRPVETTYIWSEAEQSYLHDCTYFSDEPKALNTALHSAELYVECGDYDAAAAIYRSIYSTNAEAYSASGGGQLTLLDLPREEQLQMFPVLERAYYTSFAGYRLAQFWVANGDVEAAAHLADELGTSYQAGDHGYVYVAMARAYVQAAPDEACEAAMAAFDRAYETGNDPGIPVDEDLSFGVEYYYMQEGHTYGAPPTNLFAVPESINHFINTPVCL